MSISKLDRALQRELLEALGEHYPLTHNILPKLADDYQKKVIANLIYLEEQGLINAGIKQYNDGSFYSTGSRITAAGIDFLADDGSLSAILGVVTVKFHEDTLRTLIEDRITASDLAPPDKHRLLDQLRELRGESIKHLTMKLLDAGMENWPAALLAIQTFLQAAAK